MTSGSRCLDLHAPAAAAALDSVVATTWQVAAALGRSEVVTLAARMSGSLLATVPLLATTGDTGPPSDDAAGTDWRTLDGLGDADRAILAFAEQSVLDVSAMTPELRADFLSAAGTDAGDLAAALWVVDLVPRTRAALDALCTPGPWPAPTGGGGDLWSALDGLITVVPGLDALDPVTSELVRLRGARQHRCRLCQSIRSRTALRAGADETLFDAVDDYRGSDLSPLRQAALAFTDGMVWTPGDLGPAADELRAVATPAQQVELVLDITRNALNKIAVGLGADAAHVEDGIEIYDVEPDGSLVYGLTLD
jgi:AhpD family alkylhydroperoxidase